MPLTIKNHYNPCFWTAYWNFDYSQSKKEKLSIKIAPRKQKVYCLNLKSNKILHLKTEDVFFVKRAGIATITPEVVKGYLSYNDGEEYEEEILENYKTDVILDFENHFTFMEEAYRKHLEKLIVTNDEIDTEYKVYLTTFIVHQVLRNPIMLNQMEKTFSLLGMEKFEVLFSLKEKLSNSDQMMGLYAPIVIPQWKIYKTAKNLFPLSNSPMLGKNQNIMIPVAPNIMIEVNLKQRCSNVRGCKVKTRISFWKYRDFIRRTIKGSTKEIIFGDEELLRKIQKSKLYKKHLKTINVC
jgi:hypothetical protein